MRHQTHAQAPTDGFRSLNPVSASNLSLVLIPPFAPILSLFLGWVPASSLLPARRLGNKFFVPTPGGGAVGTKGPGACIPSPPTTSPTPPPDPHHYPVPVLVPGGGGSARCLLPPRRLEPPWGGGGRQERPSVMMRIGRSSPAPGRLRPPRRRRGPGPQPCPHATGQPHHPRRPQGGPLSCDDGGGETRVQRLTDGEGRIWVT